MARVFDLIQLAAIRTETSKKMAIKNNDNQHISNACNDQSRILVSTNQHEKNIHHKNRLMKPLGMGRDGNL